MKKYKIFPIFNIFVLLIVGICVCSIAFAQQKPNENTLTKDITFSHVDGGKKITLDASKHLDLNSDEIEKLIKVLSVSQIENIDTSFQGVLIELLKPANSDIQPKSLVIREIRSSSSSKILYIHKEKPIELDLKQIEELELPKSLIEDLNILADTIVVPKNDIDTRNNKVYIKLHNTTKSRINLEDWQIRITYGSALFLKKDKDPQIIDIMSYVDERDNGEKLPQLGNSAPDFIFPGYITMTRKIDFTLLSDPAKTQSEQLAAISDGMKNKNWVINWTHKVTTAIPSWIEIHDDIENLIHNKDKNSIIWINPDSKKREIQQEIERLRRDDNTLQPEDR